MRFAFETLPAAVMRFALTPAATSASRIAFARCCARVRSAAPTSMRIFVARSALTKVTALSICLEAPGAKVALPLTNALLANASVRRGAVAGWAPPWMRVPRRRPAVR